MVRNIRTTENKNIHEKQSNNLDVHWSQLVIISNVILTYLNINS